MSGTSTDGVDASLVEVKGKGLETEVDLIASETLPFPEDIRQRIFELFNQFEALRLIWININI